MMGSMRRTVCVIAALALIAITASDANANILINGDFETGDLTGWTTFTTPQGTANISVQTFDVISGTPSPAATFAYVGLTQDPYGTGNYQGGGIFQNVALLGGNYSLSLDNAVAVGLANGDGTIISLLFDGNTVASYDYGDVNGNSIYRQSLSASLTGVSAGMHEVRVLVTRNYYGTANVTSYVDNVNLVSAVPEPASIISLGIGGLVILGHGRRRMARSAA
ncbi:MAG: hypothetical protein ABS79_01770 [Planctomycetes bacterium SCN 63-9]|nr:MAG: hypothetical protein ABS79_01770 [Planctomycetes bacterium SCN 63-9]